jgi:GrpB-like predicted nucleotidyltransferase (UPF0157 family)
MDENIGNLSTSELGRLFPITIVDYNPDWPEIFLMEKRNIYSILDDKVISRIEHIGSTAVPGLCAKPTIDILLEVRENADPDLLVSRLRCINYQYIPKPDNPPPHMMFAKGYTMKGIIGQTFHIHARYPGDWDEIIFRDFLRVTPEVALKYIQLKRELSAEFRNDREKYTESKSAFIKETTRNARLIRQGLCPDP